MANGNSLDCCSFLTNDFSKEQTFDNRSRISKAKRTHTEQNATNICPNDGSEAIEVAADEETLAEVDRKLALVAQCNFLERDDAGLSSLRQAHFLCSGDSAQQLLDSTVSALRDDDDQLTKDENDGRRRYCSTRATCIVLFVSVIAVAGALVMGAFIGSGRIEVSGVSEQLGFIPKEQNPVAMMEDDCDETESPKSKSAKKASVANSKSGKVANSKSGKVAKSEMAETSESIIIEQHGMSMEHFSQDEAAEDVAVIAEIMSSNGIAELTDSAVIAGKPEKKPSLNSEPVRHKLRGVDASGKHGDNSSGKLRHLHNDNPNSKASKCKTKSKSAQSVTSAPPTFTAPFCSRVSSSCTTGELVNFVGYQEGNSPSNTIDACRDGLSIGQDVVPPFDPFEADSCYEFIQNITVSSLLPGLLRAGEMAKIEADVFAFGQSQFVDFYYTDSIVFPPVWTFIGFVIPNVDENGGYETVSVTYTLPSTMIQAVRVNIYTGGSAFGTISTPPCTQNSYSDVDDLIITVAPAAA